MMKIQPLKWIIPVLLALFSSGCIIDINDDSGLFGNCINGNGPIVSAELNLPTIEGVNLELDAIVYLTQGDQQQITIEGKQNIIDRIDLDVNDRIWNIRSRRCLRDVDQLTIYITLPRLEYVKLSGSGKVISEDFINTDDIELFISGSGDIDLGLHSDDIDSKISGSGTITLEGTADEFQLEISGSGDYRTFGMQVNKAFVKIAGSGDAELNVLDLLDVRISGSGDVFYKGTPSVSVQISGSGEVINSN